jgi:uncharacterized repeat protein (TIGR03803 family)
MLYGTTYSTVTTNLGTVFRLRKDGTGFVVLKSFFNPRFLTTSGAGPLGELCESTNGMLYGTTSLGGTNGTGTIYQLNKDGTGYKTLYHFIGNNSFVDPTGARLPQAGLILAGDGMLYGTTFDGGTNGNGTVFRIDQDGVSFQVTASLLSVQGPASGLIEGTNGMLYGTTQLGGESGAGSVYAVQKDGSGFLVLKNFSATGGDGQSAYSAPMAGTDEVLYGTTRLGGETAAGSIYSLRFDGVGYQVNASLGNIAGLGTNVAASLFEAYDSRLYGVTQFGGDNNYGSIFSVGKGSNDVAAVFSPTNAADGREFSASLIQGSDGVLYGTTARGRERWRRKRVSAQCGRFRLHRAEKLRVWFNRSRCQSLPGTDSRQRP